MVGPVDGLNSLNPAGSRLRTSQNNPAAASGAEETSRTDDTLDLSSEQVVDAIRVQAGVLQGELPGLIAEALLAPVSDTVTRSEPLNNLLFRLVNPLDSILGRLPSEDIPENLILGLQEEIRNLRSEIPRMADHQLLTRFTENLAQSDPLNALITELTNPLDDLVARLEVIG